MFTPPDPVIPLAVGIPPPTRADGVRVNAAQRTALLNEVENLAPEQWDAPTECARWTVREVVAHVIASAEHQRRPERMMAGMTLGRLRYRGLSALDAVNERGVDRHRGKSPGELVAALREWAGQGVGPHRLRVLPVRYGKMPSYANGAYLFDVIYPRDTWMHRHDIARALGTAPAQDPTDADVVVQVVRDIGLTWRGPDLVLELTGPEGGVWVLESLLDPAGPGPGAEREVPDTRVTLPAVELLHHLSGREADPHLFDDVPQRLRRHLDAARVMF